MYEIKLPEWCGLLTYMREISIHQAQDGGVAYDDKCPFVRRVERYFEDLGVSRNVGVVVVD